MNGWTFSQNPRAEGKCHHQTQVAQSSIITALARNLASLMFGLSMCEHAPYHMCPILHREREKEKKLTYP